MRKIVYSVISMALFILCGCHGDPWDIGDHYTYMNGNIYRKIGHTYYGPSLNIVIPGYVCSFNYDDKYIIAHQKADYLSCTEMTEIVHDNNKIDSVKAVYDKIMKLRDCYWIIIQKTDEVFGPLDKKSFFIKCKELSIKICLD